jgi:DNA-binding CsgD family transcriptional regulator
VVSPAGSAGSTKTVGRTPLSTAGITARDGIVRASANELPPLELLEEVARRVRSVVPYAAAGWLLTDPATLLHTGAFTEDVPRDLHLRLIDNELADDDFAKFSQIARSSRSVLSLSEATDGELERSARFRKIYAPEGYGAELRAAFRTRDACWAVACFAREEGAPDFDDEEVEFLASISEHVAHGLRGALLIDASQEPSPHAEAPGMLVLDEDNNLESQTGEAERWLCELPSDALDLPSAVHHIAHQARAHARNGGAGPPARARVRLRSGSWLLVHGACLRADGGDPERVAVVLEPARSSDLASMIVDLYELTEREREITQLLVSGMPMNEIAEVLFISQHTVRDHVKAIFAKFGVSSRPELTAMLFHEHFLPELAANARR